MKLFDVLAYIESLQEREDAIAALAELRHIAKAVSNSQSVIDPLALEQAEKYPKNFVHAGIAWTRKAGSRRFVYDDIPEVDSLKRMLAAQQEKHKIAAEMVTNSLGTQLHDGCVQIGDELIRPAKIEFSKDSLTMDKGQK